MDVKGPLQAYERWCGVSVDKERIRESIAFILEERVDYEFRMTLVPFLHREDDALEVAREIKGLADFLQEFVPRDTLNPKYAHIRPFSTDKMKSMRERVAAILEHAPVSSRLH